MEGGRPRPPLTVSTADGPQQYLPTIGTVVAADHLARFLRPGLIEEYSVSVDGIRQDFLVLERPAGTGELRVELELTGAEAEAAAQGVLLTLASSRRTLAYGRLLASDATGRELTARMEVLAPNRLAVRVDDTNATYPVRIDPTFSDADWVSLNPGFPGANGSIAAMVTDGSGNLYVGGIFTIAGSVEANRIAKWDGSEWTAVGSGMDGWVYALAVSGTDLYAGGLFTSADGVTVNHVSKWDGRTWSPLGSGVDGDVWALALIGTDLYVGGEFASAGGVPANHIARWGGSSWSALGSGVNDDVYALAVNGADLCVGGEFTSAGGVGANHIARWEGNNWSALGQGVAYRVYALAADGAGLYAAGWSINQDYTYAAGIARWNGSSWSAMPFDWSIGRLNALAVVGTELYVGGIFTTSESAPLTYVARWNGSAWSDLGPGMDVNGEVSSLAGIGTDLYTGGGFVAAGGTVADHIARWDGTAWSAVGDGLDVNVYALAVNGAGLYVGGSIRSVTADQSPIIFSWDGSTWSTLGSGGGGDWGWFSALAFIGSNLYAAGTFPTLDGVPANNIARWDGNLWSALGAGVGSMEWHSVQALAVSGSDLYAGGDFDRAGGATANSIARWDGSAWSTLGSGLTDIDHAIVKTLAVSGTDLYAGGSFTAAGGVPANSIARWDGSTWSALGSGMDGQVEALAVIGTELYVGGYFTTAGGMPTNHIARWDGSSWSALGSGVEGEDAVVCALAVSGVDLYAGGRFTTAGGVPANNIAKWDGSSWSALASGVPRGRWRPRVDALAADDAGHLFVGGRFTHAGTSLSPFIAQANIGAVAPVLHHFTWMMIPSPQAAESPIPVTLAARGYSGATVTSFTGIVTLSGQADGGSTATNIVVGDGTDPWEYPMYAYYHDARTQVIYPAGELGAACTITSLALEVTTPPGQTMENWTIRMKHTALAEYPDSPAWEGSGWTVVYQADEPAGSSGWRTFTFQTPFAYNGADNLLVDFSFDNNSYSSAGQCRSATYATYRSIYFWTDSEHGDPSTWSGASPAPVRSQNVPNLMLGLTREHIIPVVISPGEAGPFVDGVWTGEVIVHESASNVILRADDGQGHDGESGSFDVEASSPAPVLVLGEDPLGYTNGCYGFDVQAPSRQVVVIEASTNLVQWRPVHTNLTGELGEFLFYDMETGLYPHRFYRASLYEGVLPSPQLLTGGFGSWESGFGLTVGAVGGQQVVVEASTNLVVWQPILTNTAAIGPLYLTDPDMTNYPHRFYRAVTP